MNSIAAETGRPQGERAEARWRISAGLLAAALAACGVLLHGLAALAAIRLYGPNVGKLEALFLLKFDVIRDQTLPTLFDSFVFQLLALLSAWSGAVDKRAGDRSGWFVLAMVFAMLAIDDVLGLHEAVSTVITEKLDPAQKLGGAFYYAWVVVAIPVMLALGLLLLRWFLRLPVRTRVLAAASGGLFLSAAIGLEMVNASIDFREGWDDPLYRWLSSLEELLETLCPLLFVYAVLDHLRRKGARLTVDVAA